VTDLVGDFENLGLLCGLGLLEGALEAGEDVFGEGSSGSDGDVEFALVLGKELIETFNNTLGFVQSAVFREESEEVLGDLGRGILLCARALELGEESLETLLALLMREGGVVDEATDVWLGLDSVGDAGKLRVDFGESCWRLGKGSAEDSLGVFGGDGGRRTAVEPSGQRC